MAHGMSTTRPLKLQQALHGYSEGHRLLGSSIDLEGRDAKTMLMMSDASGPAAVIGINGYLTGYPLTESGYYAFARTWPAPEMPRPGCVWTHTILVEFSDIPALQNANGVLGLFRRPRSKDRGYNDALMFVSEGPAGVPPDPAAARRILWAIYGNPSKPIVSSMLEQHERDELVLAMWDQQWPRLKRTFRFCTLSFADRSAGGNVFDLQFLPGSGGVPRVQFRTAFDADRSDFEFSDWLDDAVSDLSDGADGDLRQFLRAAGSDVSGREAFVPLASLHALSKQFASVPEAVEQAISLLENSIPDSQGHAARALIARVAAAAPYNLGLPALQFVVRHFDLIEEDDAAAYAENIGKALWMNHPEIVIELLSDDSQRRQIAKRGLASLPLPVLLQGAAVVPQHRQALFDARPDLGTEPAYWSLPDAWSAVSLQRAAEHADLVPAIIAAMVRSDQPSIYEACRAFGNEKVLRALVRLLGDGEAELLRGATKAWLSEAASDRNAVARCLCDENIARTSTLEALARAVTPDSVPNEFGDDPWLIGLRRTEKLDNRPALYLPSFLLARALGRRTRNCADLIQIAFDSVYTATERSVLPDDAWRLLDDRLYRSFFWASWDRCERIRQSVVALFVNKSFDPKSFITITSRNDVFELLVEIAASSYSGQSYLKLVHGRLSHDGNHHERLRTIRRAVW
jgi:hypothetical protein